MKSIVIHDLFLKNKVYKITPKDPEGKILIIIKPINNL